ncbi:MAG: hypothetical protein R2771_12805 [Saprospiraceae bacterium]
MPLVLLDFDYKTLNDNVLLSWTTEQDINVTEFVIEKAGKTLSWQQLGNITSKNNYSKTNYEFYDNALIGINYYRLKITDNDGSVYYSPVISYNMNTDDVFTSYPNPCIGTT